MLGIFGLLVPLFAQTKYALVIGNAKYQRIGKLTNTIKDAEDISRALRNLDYQVDMKTDVSRSELISAIYSYTQRLSANPANEGFFWYAGHAVQINNENYLLPIDVNVDNEEQILSDSYSLSRLLTVLKGAWNRANVVILDACRDNPLPRSAGRSAGSRGLSVVNDVPGDLFVMFSTAPGDKAEDGLGKRNSPFAEAFLKYITLSDPLVVVATDIIRETMRLTGNRQQPFHRGSIISDRDYSLNRRPAQVMNPPTPAPIVSTGSVQVTSAIAGSIVIDGRDTGVRVKADGTMTVSGVHTGQTEVAVKGDDGRITKAAQTVLVRAGQTVGAVIERPLPPAPVLTAPRNVRAGTPGTDSVSLTWDSAGSSVSYKVYYGMQNDASRASLLNSASGTSMNVTSMASNSTYYFWVATVQNGQESGKSPVLTVRTAAVPVQPPVSADMVRIQGGTFTMGSPSGYDSPEHKVTLSGFSIGKYEVTVANFRAFVQATGYKTDAETSDGAYVEANNDWVKKADANWKNPYFTQTENSPVTCVSWNDVVNYCNWKSRQEGLIPAYTISGTNVSWNRSANGYRLPTEAEWEYACRAGTTTPYSSGTSVDNAGWYGGNSGRKTHPVGTKQANAWGLYDMHGNVREWCWDWYGDYSSANQTDPSGAASGSYRVLRGGGWSDDVQLLRSVARDGDSPAGLRSAYRIYNTPTGRNSSLGFRLVRP
ncbi:hypothetical protein FACS1894200_07080 [Spirochaetia bacterium]|nr:hypothetical protein FACS1894200_07080 [Spirochaetia bacterium]